MEDIWKRVKGLAEEAARRSQTLTSSVNISDLVTETTKKSMELAAEASKKADQIKSAALDQIQIQQLSLSPSPTLSPLSSPRSPILLPPPPPRPPPLPTPNRRSALSVSLTIWETSSRASLLLHSRTSRSKVNTQFNSQLPLFSEFFLIWWKVEVTLFKFAEEAEASDVATTVSNVRKDLTEWQEKHATIVLTTVKVGSFHCFSFSMLFNLSILHKIQFGYFFVSIP